MKTLRSAVNAVVEKFKALKEGGPGSGRYPKGSGKDAGNTAAMGLSKTESHAAFAVLDKLSQQDLLPYNANAMYDALKAAKGTSMTLSTKGAGILHGVLDKLAQDGELPSQLDTLLNKLEKISSKSVQLQGNAAKVTARFKTKAGRPRLVDAEKAQSAYNRAIDRKYKSAGLTNPWTGK